MMYVIIAVGCGAGQSPHVEVRDSAGVRVVIVDRIEEQLPWSADTVLLLGGADAGVQGFYRVSSALVDVDSSGRIYVLDQTAHRVAVFDSLGRLVTVFGREGGGPGELRSPLAVAVSAEGEVVVHDASKGSLVWFDSSGRPLPEERFGVATINTHLRHVDLVGTAVVAWMRDRYVGTDERHERLVWVSGGDTVNLVSLEPGRTSTAPYPACGMTFTVRVPLSPYIYWSQSGGRIAVAAWGDDRIDVFDDGGLAYTLQLGPLRSEIGEAEAIRRIEAMGYTGPCNADAREIVKKHGFYPLPQRIRGVAVAPDGALWVRRIDSGGDLRIEVLDSVGWPVGILPEGFPMPIAFLPDGRPLIEVRDSRDVERLGVLRVRQ